MEGRRLEYPLSPKYIPSWSVGEALRELIANALDTKARTRFEWADGYGLIEDAAEGIPQAFWVIGEGQHGAIGQFGEGLKMAMLVLAREKRDVAVETVGYQVRPGLAYSDVYASEVLVLEYAPNERSRGTTIRVSCSEEEFQSARQRFLKLDPLPVLHANLGILGAPGRLYVNGVYVQEIGALWGYNVTDKALANRDRSVLDMTGVQRHVASVIMRLNKLPLITQLVDKAAHLGSGESFVEVDVVVHPHQKHRSLWRRAFRELFGDKACLPSYGAFDRNAEGLGWRVMHELPYGVRYALGSAGVPDSQAVLKGLRRQKFVWPKDVLTEEEQAVFAKAKSIAKELVPDADVTGTNVVEELPTDDQNCHTEGLYRNRTVYVRRGCLSSMAKTTGVLIHERLHGKGYHDETRAFENAMTDLLGQLAVKLSEVAG
jgi:hypothetical protein